MGHIFPGQVVFVFITFFVFDLTDPTLQKLTVIVNK